MVQKLRAYQGRVVVLHFWATWCPYCRNEIPELREIQRRWVPKQVVIVTVGIDEQASSLVKFVRSQQLPYPVIADAKQNFALSGTFQVAGVPQTFVIDREGVIVQRVSGAGELVAAVQAAVSKP